MKNTIAIIMSLLWVNCLWSQDIFEKSIPINKSAKVELDFQFADQIIIKTWNKNEAYVKATVNINDNEDNDKFSLNGKEKSGYITFVSDIDDLESLHKEVVIQQGVVVRGDDKCVHMEIDFEVYLPANVGIDLETISGDIEIIGFDSPMKIESISGFIDVSLSPSAKVDIKMETITGEFYSDLELKTQKQSKWKHHYVGGELEASINGGGKEIELKTISGNIYLRKK